MANEWLDNMLQNKITKEAMESQGTDKQDHFERKVQAHDWIKGVSELDPVKVEAEYQAKLEEEQRILLGKTAAYEMGETPKETIKKDYERDVKILSDYALAEMLAEARGHEEQNTSEMFYELKEKAKAEVASSREKAEKALLELVGEHSMLDWQKAFEKFTKEAKPEEPKEKDLFKSEVPEKAHDFEHPTEEKFKLPPEKDKAIPGNGREEDERKDVTAEAGVLKEDIVKGTSKEASLKEAHCGECPGDPGHEQAGAADQASLDKESAPNQAVIDAFISGKGGVPGTNLHTVKHANGLVLVNYETPIAFKATDGDLFLNSDKYSATTSKIQSQIAQAAHGEVKHVSAEELNKIMAEPAQEIVKPENVINVPEPVEAAAESPLKREELPVEKKADGCPVCGGMGKDLGNGAKDNMSCEACGVTYACGSLAPKADMQRDLDDMEKMNHTHLPNQVEEEDVDVESPEEIAETFINGNISDAREWVGGDLDKFMAVMEVLGYGSPEGQSFQRIMRKHASKEIKTAATRSDVIKKVAEVSSPWIVTKDANGNEVIARVEQPTNKKESEEDKTEELTK